MSSYSSSAYYGVYDSSGTSNNNNMNNMNMMMSGASGGGVGGYPTNGNMLMMGRSQSQFTNGAASFNNNFYPQQQQYNHFNMMQHQQMPARPQASIEFLVSRPTLDLPPFEIQLLSQSQPPMPLPPVAQTRSIDGVVRITIESPTNAALLAEKLVLRFRGGRVNQHETLLKLLLWQPSSKEEFNNGLLPGRHDFPFALDIPSSLHAAAEGAKVPQIPPGPAGAVSDHFRTYELSATLHSFVNNVMVEDSASKPVNVRRCFPSPWVSPEIPLTKHIGTTNGGELTYKAITPRLWVFGDKRECYIDVTLDDGSETTSRITAIDCQLMQRLRHREAPANGLPVTMDHIPATVSSAVGPGGRGKVPPLNLGKSAMTLTVKAPMQPMQPDAEMDPFLLEHTVSFSISISRMMMTKKAAFSIPIRMVIPADNDDRLLNSVPIPQQWVAAHIAASGSQSMRNNVVSPGGPSMSVTSGGSSSGSRSGKPSESVKTDDLSTLLSLGVGVQPSSSSGRKKPGKSSSQDGNSPNRRPSTTSSGSGGTASTGQYAKNAPNNMNVLVASMDGLFVSPQAQVGPGTPPQTPRSVLSNGSSSLHANPYPQYAASNMTGGNPLTIQTQPAQHPNPTDFFANPPSPASVNTYMFPGPAIPQAAPGMPSIGGFDARGQHAPAMDLRRPQQNYNNPYLGSPPSFPQPPPSTSSGGLSSPTNNLAPPAITGGGSSSWDSSSIKAVSISSGGGGYANSPLPSHFGDGANHSTPSAPAPAGSSSSLLPPQAPPPTQPLPPPPVAPPRTDVPPPPPPSNPPPPPPASVVASVEQAVEAAPGEGGVQQDAAAAAQQQEASKLDASHVFQVQFAFTPTLQDELLLNVGDLVEVLEAFDDGWARGKNQNLGPDSEPGYFPIRCLVLPTANGDGDK